ncbi:hypothetical protein OIV83_004089 [Microbotryomycetes sp. JL201]|nr:hypothetical protein OIV83_004089 [Microbotryomycetes sp. JL201]
MTAPIVHPEARPPHIHTLINGVDRYNPSNCHLLEDYLSVQMKNNSYDLMSNLALLKLYQFNPALLSPSSVLSVLFISLSHAPFSPDFALAWALLGDSFVNGADLPPPQPTSDDEDDDEDERARQPQQPNGERETAQHLQQLSQHLHARQFKAFWQALRSPPQKATDQLADLTASASGFESTLRSNIAKEVEQSFRSLSRQTLASFLGVQADSNVIQDLATSQNWSIEADQVKLGKNESNAPTSTVTNEKITIDQLSRLLGRTQA